MRKVGREIMDGKGLCFTCHTVGKKGAAALPGPRRHRRPRRRPACRACPTSSTWRSRMYEPDKFIVPGFNPGMPPISKPPIGLTRRRDPGGDRLSPEPGRHHHRDHADQAAWQAGGGAAVPRRPRRRAGGAAAPAAAAAAAPGQDAGAAELAADRAGSDDAMNLPIVWWVVLLLARGAACCCASAAPGRSSGPWSTWFSSVVFLRFGFTVPVPQSVISLYMGIVDPGDARLRHLQPRAAAGLHRAAGAPVRRAAPAAAAAARCCSLLPALVGVRRLPEHERQARGAGVRPHHPPGAARHHHGAREAVRPGQARQPLPAARDERPRGVRRPTWPTAGASTTRTASTATATPCAATACSPTA